MNLLNRAENINTDTGINMYHEYIRLIIKRFYEECVYEPGNILKIRLKTSGAKDDDPGNFFRVVNLYVEEDNTVRVDLSGLPGDNGDLYGFRLADLNPGEQRKIFVRLTSDLYMLRDDPGSAEDRRFLRELLAGT